MNGSLKTPYAGLLPPLSSEEFEALRSSIEAEGVRDPIVIDEEGSILDGHHRYRIRPDAPTRVHTGLTPGAKKAFVIAANLTRRNLSTTQKAALREAQMTIAVELKRDGLTQEQVAAALGIAEGTVAVWLRPSGILDDKNTGGPLPDKRRKPPVNLSEEQIAEIRRRFAAGEKKTALMKEYGITGWSTMDRITAAAPAKPRKWNGNGAHIPVPEGTTAEAICRRGMEMESGDIDATRAARAVGINASSYRQMRDIVLLADRHDLSQRDQELAQAALRELNETRRVKSAHASIEPLIGKVWGGKGHPRTEQSVNRRREEFRGAVDSVTSGCGGLTLIEVPHLDEALSAEIMSKLNKAKNQLAELIKRLKRERSSTEHAKAIQQKDALSNVDTNGADRGAVGDGATQTRPAACD